MQKIYVLRCQSGKYYVGKTSDVDRRFAEHMSDDYGSEWTRCYKPKKLVKVVTMKSDFDEMKITLEYMKKYGIDRVRGAQWSNITLTPEQRHHIISSMNTDGCFHCGDKGHFSKDCTNRNQSFQSLQTIQCYKCEEYGHYANECTNMQCERCGRDSHPEEDCYAETDIDGDIIGCARCGRTSHTEEDCYATSDVGGNILGCARCGRDSHSADRCYAKTDIDGRRL